MRTVPIPRPEPTIFVPSGLYATLRQGAVRRHFHQRRWPFIWHPPLVRLYFPHTLIVPSAPALPCKSALPSGLKATEWICTAVTAELYNPNLVRPIPTYTIELRFPVANNLPSGLNATAFVEVELGNESSRSIIVIQIPERHIGIVGPGHQILAVGGHIDRSRCSPPGGQAS